MHSDDFQQILRNNAFFNSNYDMWNCALRIFGTINIVDIIGVRNRMADFNDNLGEALNSRMFVNRVELGIQHRLHELRRGGQINDEGNQHDEYGFLTWFTIRIRDRGWGSDYAEALLNNNLADEFLMQNANPTLFSLNIPLKEAIQLQPRQDAPKPQSNPHNAPYCAHCASFSHRTVDCKKAGSVQRNNRGEMVALGDFPKCFVCSTRNRKVSDKIFHNSQNCPLRHPLSRIGVNRKCSKCQRWMERCWNCAIPVCLNKRCEEYGHTLTSCTQQRIKPLQQSHGQGVDFRLSLEQRMEILGIRHIPRELRFIHRSRGQNEENEGTTESGDDRQVDIIDNLVEAVEEVIPEQEICTICLDDINLRSSVKIQCGHSYHADCFQEFKNRSENIFCPLCRSNETRVVERNAGEQSEAPSTSQQVGAHQAGSSGQTSIWADIVPTNSNFYYNPNDWGNNANVFGNGVSNNVGSNNVANRFGNGRFNNFVPEILPEVVPSNSSQSIIFIDRAIHIGRRGNIIRQSESVILLDEVGANRRQQRNEEAETRRANRRQQRIEEAETRTRQILLRSIQDLQEPSLSVQGHENLAEFISASNSMFLDFMDYDVLQMVGAFLYNAARQHIDQAIRSIIQMVVSRHEFERILIAVEDVGQNDVNLVDLINYIRQIVTSLNFGWNN